MAQIEVRIVAHSAEDYQMTLAALVHGAPPAAIVVGSGDGGVDTSSGEATGGAAGGGTATGSRGGARTKKDESKEDSKVMNAPKDDVKESETTGAALNYDDHIKPAILRLAMAKGRGTPDEPNSVMGVISKFGAKEKASEIDAKDWPALLEAVETAIAAED